MSKQNQTEWRCPYCDGLNDWQDEVCQICGDGKRDEVVSSEKKKSSVSSQQPKMQYQTQSQNTYDQQPTRKDVRSERKQSAPETKVRESQPKPDLRKPEPEVKKPEPEVKYSEPRSATPAKKPKKKKHWGLIPVAAVLIAGGLYGFSVHKADTLVKDMDFKLLEEAPYTSMDGFKSWAENQGYEVADSKEGTGFFTDYSVDSGKSDWNISVSEGNRGVEIKYEADGQNLNEVYKKLKDALKDRNWDYQHFLDENPTFDEGIKGKKYRATQLWHDEKNNWYELALKDKEITITREDGPASSDEMVAEADLDFLQNSPQENILDSESWLKQKGYHYTVSGTEHYSNYDITNPQSADWNISYIGHSSGKSFSVAYNALEKDCTDLPALYESLKAKLEISGFTVVCQEAETAERADENGGKFMIWQDPSGNLYDLFLWNGAYYRSSEVDLVRENNKDCASDAVSYDLKDPSDQLNIAALVSMPMNSYIGDENWKQKFNENYGNANYQPIDMAEGDSWCRAYFMYHPSNLENKKELLRYLKKEIQEATGKKMQLSSAFLYKNGFDYTYEIETKQNRITLSADDSVEYISISIEGNSDK